MGVAGKKKHFQISWYFLEFGQLNYFIRKMKCISNSYQFKEKGKRIQVLPIDIKISNFRSSCSGTNLKKINFLVGHALLLRPSPFHLLICVLAMSAMLRHGSDLHMAHCTTLLHLLHCTDSPAARLAGVAWLHGARRANNGAALQQCRWVIR